MNTFQFDWTYPLAIIWGFVVVASFIGWGRTLGFWLGSSQGQDDWGWGSEAAWGMTAFLILSGPLLMLSIFSTGFVALFLLSGLGLLAWSLRLGSRNRDTWHGPPTFGLKALFVILCLLVLLTYAGAVADHGYNDGDDFQAYFGFSKMALDMGTLSDPFNIRLLGSMGGQPILTTLVVSFLPWKYVHLLDMGIAELIMLGLTLELVRGNDNRAWRMRLLLVAIALTFPMPRQNTASEMTGVVLFLALFRCLSLITDGILSGGKAAFLFGALTAAVSTLRCHNPFVIAVVSVGFITWGLVKEKAVRKETLRFAAMTMIIAAGLLIPWCVVTFRSSGAFFYPLFKGTQIPDMTMSGYSFSFLEKLEFTSKFFVFSGYLLFFMPPCLVYMRRARQVLLMLAVTILLISSLVIFQLAGYYYYDISRYLDPFAFAFGLYSCGIAMQQFVTLPRASHSAFENGLTRLVVISGAAVLILQMPNFGTQSLINLVHIAWATDARYEIASRYEVGAPPSGHRLSLDEERRTYPEAFSRIPAGSKALIALSYPFLLNYKTHSIYSIDFTGDASPKPQLPYFAGAEPVKHYLLSLDIRYIAQVHFDQKSYRFHSRELDQKLIDSWPLLYKIYAQHDIDFFDNLDQLAKTNHVLYDSPTIRVIDLGSP